MTVKWESDLLITSMITDRIGQLEVLLLINQNYDKIWERNKTSVLCFYKKKEQQLSWQNARQQHMRLMHSVHSYKHDVLTVPLAVLLHCPISAQIRLVIAIQVWEFCYTFDEIHVNDIILVAISPACWTFCYSV